MRRCILVCLIASAVFSARPADVAIATLHQAMQQIIAPQAQIIWDVGNAAFDEDGKLDGRKITNSGWKDVSSAAQTLQAAAQLLAQAQDLIVAAPGEKIEEEGNPDAADAKAVQGYINANSHAFRARAKALRAAAAHLLKASVEHDSVTFSRVSNGLDKICEDCHERFWYPEPRK